MRTPDQVSTHPESGMTRALYDCPMVPLTPTGPEVRLVVATHPATSSSPAVGSERDGTVYELFVSTLPSPAFTASDVLDLYLHRGSFETVLADEDDEQEFDRWYFHTLCSRSSPRSSHNGFGIFDWNWDNNSRQQSCAPPNLRQPLRLKPSRKKNLGQRRSPRLQPSMALPNGLVPPLPTVFPAQLLFHNRTEHCVAPLTIPCIRKSGAPPRNGSLRILYAARIGHCRSCPLRTQCQESSTMIKPRRVSAVLWPLECSPPAHTNAPVIPPRAPVLWKDWPRCDIRRRWLKVVRSEAVSLTESVPTPTRSSTTAPSDAVLTRAERAHWRLSWEQRLARNARPGDAPRLFVTLHGLPATFAHAFGFDLLDTA